MSFFVDANILIYSAVSGPHREACLEILEAIARGDAKGRTSSAVLEEVWHIERSGRAGDLDRLTERAYLLMSPLLPVDDDAFSEALAISARSMGTNDRLHVGTCVAHGIDQIVSADRDFDEVQSLRRIDPGDASSVEALLR